MAPVERGAQGALARRGGAVTRAKHGEAVAEAPGDLLRGERAGARRGQFDGQRNAIQGPADGGHSLAVVLGEDETGARRRGPVREELDRVVSEQDRRLRYDAVKL